MYSMYKAHKINVWLLTNWFVQVLPTVTVLVGWVVTVLHKAKAVVRKFSKFKIEKSCLLNSQKVIKKNVNKENCTFQHNSWKVALQ